MEKIYDYEERLVRFAGEIIKFVNSIHKTYAGNYYASQLIRSSGSSALNYGEVQGTVSEKDFVHKMSIVVKELKESRGTLKILNYANMGNTEPRNWLLKECEELVAIGATLLLKKKRQLN